jgi:hypothetical protein
LAALLAITSSATAKRRPIPLPCPEGQFTVSGAALMDPFAASDTIVIDGTQLAVTSGCGPTTLIIRRTMHVLAFGGHMHKRGARFSAWHSDGTKIFDDYDWAHPVGRPFVPPYVLAPGDWIGGRGRSPSGSAPRTRCAS